MPSKMHTWESVPAVSSWFSPSTPWVPGMGIRSPGLAVGAFTLPLLPQITILTSLQSNARYNALYRWSPPPSCVPLQSVASENTAALWCPQSPLTVYLRGFLPSAAILLLPEIPSVRLAWRRFSFLICLKRLSFILSLERQCLLKIQF